MSYQLSVDSVVIYSGWFGNFKREIATSNPFYFGGIPTSLKIPFTVPTHVSLTMDVQSFVINNRFGFAVFLITCKLDSFILECSSVIFEILTYGSRPYM